MLTGGDGTIAIAGIGVYGPGPGPADINIDVSGDILLNGGNTVAESDGGMAAIGSEAQDVNVNIGVNRPFDGDLRLTGGDSPYGMALVGTFCDTCAATVTITGDPTIHLVDGTGRMP